MNVFITGAARRIGAALARAFHARGDRVVVHYLHSQAEATALVAELNAERPHSALALCGVSVADDAQLVAAALAFFGDARIDVLINNGSQFFETPLQSLTRAQFDALMAANCAGALFLTQAALPALQQSSNACVINIVDVNTHNANFVAYAASKAALLSVTRSLAAELAPRVRVNAISPGVMLWPEHVPHYDRDAALANVPLRRVGTPQPVVDAALYLARATFVTGQNLACDGGASLKLLM
jgi:pteridine reductase